MAQIRFAKIKINHILNPISKTKQNNYSINTFLGNPGSNDIEYLSTGGRVLSFKSIVDRQHTSVLSRYRNLARKYRSNRGVLVGASDLDVNGNYYLTGYNEEKQVNGSFIVSWEFTEYVKPNIVRKTFRSVGKQVTKRNNLSLGLDKKIGHVDKIVSPKKTSKYITILLSDCGTLKYGTTNSKCVKYLQKFLQSKGYYKGYKVDGDYLQYTRAAVEQLQKAYKIRVSKNNYGQWDKVTRNWWREKYGITSKRK